MVVVEIMPRSQYPAEPRIRKGAPIFQFFSRMDFGADSWLILPAVPGTRKAKEKSSYLHLKLDKQLFKVSTSFT